MSPAHPSWLRRVVVPAGSPGLAVVRDALTQALAGGEPIAALPEPGRFVTATMVDAITAALRLEDTPCEFGDVVAVVTTSGSSGAPKGVYWTRSAVRHAAGALQDRLGPPGTWLLSMPVTSAAGVMAVARAVITQQHAVAVDSLGGAERFTPALFADAVNRARAEAPGAPIYAPMLDEQLRLLLDDPAGTDALRACSAVIVGGGRPSDAVTRARVEDMRVLVSYGMTETCGGCVYDHIPLRGVDVDVLRDTDAEESTPGQLRISGPVVTPGYRLRPELTSAALTDGVLITHDIGTVIRGKVDVLGRDDDLVKVRGVLVDLAQISALALSHPGVTAATAVVDQRGMHVLLHIESTGDVSESVVIDRVRDVVGIPLAGVTTHAPGSLPRVPGGKVDASRVREMTTWPQ